MASSRSPAGRRVRVDRSCAGPGLASDLEGGVSGRLVVTAAVLGVLVLWGGLFLAFRHWRTDYRERAAFGLARVVKAVDPLATIVPSPDVDPAAWRAAVSETRALLVTLTASNLLDRPGMAALGAEIDARVSRARARPATAPAELAALWDDLEARAGPVVARHRRPAALPAKTAANHK
jgi:hypothetical protein